MRLAATLSMRAMKPRLTTCANAMMSPQAKAVVRKIVTTNSASRRRGQTVPAIVRTRAAISGAWGGD